MFWRGRQNWPSFVALNLEVGLYKQDICHRLLRNEKTRYSAKIYLKGLGWRPRQLFNSTQLNMYPNGYINNYSLKFA